MIAFDTNMLVRLLVDDHPGQAALAQRLLADNTALIPRTVVLETEWVLRSVYKLPRERMAAFFRLLRQSENAVVEDHGVVERALAWYEQGADFADALHLAACDGAEMQTFDDRFCKQAREKGQTPAIKVWKA
ncbi:type II toxin-antitoxin system VapC family toxin [Thiohalocapsa sp. ML1]|uniref:type II toxin-antitoxin system VapC family toxin n=1 Tax=Thiohalocapsa sp. ML1 TaxID=1431688 RepID=UPI0007321143|nr:type II toxin-antitoxin system VapC family toxin [Thiohalocapsa sp. ML1]